MADQKYYEVEKLLQKKMVNKEDFYLVRWKNFPPAYDTWEPAQNLTSCELLFKAFDKQKRALKSKSVAAKLVRKSKELSNSQNNKSKKKSTGKTSQVTARQRIAEELKYKAKKLAKGEKLKPKGMKKKTVVSKKNIHIGKLNDKSKVLKRLSFSRKVKDVAEKTNAVSLTPKGAKRYNDSSPHSGTKEGPVDKKARQDLPNSSENKNTKITSGAKGQKKNMISKNMPNKNVKKSNAPKTKGNQKSIDKGKKSSKTTNLHSKIKVYKEKKTSTKRKHPDSKAILSNHEGPDLDFSIVSDSESDSDDDDDDHILYSLNDGVDEKGDGVKNIVNDKKPGTGKDPSPKNFSSSSSEKNSSGSKRMSLMAFKKPKTLKQKPGMFDQLLRPSSPTPFFTPLKVVQTSPSQGALPNPGAMPMDNSLVGDVPVFQAAPGGPLSPSSISYKTLLDNLPSQLHPRGKGAKKKEAANGASTSSGSSNSNSGAGGSRVFDPPEPIERRSSVRATECVFRYKQIVVKKCNRYTQIWLNTQTTMKNAFNPQVVQEVVAALNTAKYDDSSLVLFSSIGSFFCSGVDLHFLTTGDRRVAARQMADALRELTKAFITFPKPVIAGVGGSAVGLGVSLLCLCDVVYASDKAAFHLPYAQLSQTPEACSSFTLPLALGLASANELLFGDRRITAMEAYQLGLVSHVFWPTAFMQEVIPRAQNMANCSPKVLESTKLLIRSHHRTKMELTNETECNLLLERWSSNECQRAIEAYLANENNFSS